MTRPNKQLQKMIWVLVPACAVLSPIGHAGMKSLDDAAMADISGQRGITIESDLGVSANRLSYFDDGEGIHIEDFRMGSIDGDDSSAFHRTKINIDNEGALNLEFLVENRRIEFGDIRLGGSSGAGMGGVFFDQGRMTGSLGVRGGGALGDGGYTFDTSFMISGGRLGYRTNGNEIFLNNINMNVTANGTTLDLVDNTIQLRSPEIQGFFNVGSILYSSSPLSSYDAATLAGLDSYGSFIGNFNFTTRTDITAGGRSGEGLRIDNETIINDMSLLYQDDDKTLGLWGITGHLNTNDLRLDVTRDWNDRRALGLTWGSLEGEIDIGSVQVGMSGVRMGSVNVDFLFADHEFNGRSYTNAVYVQGGGHADAGPQGLRLAAEWSLRDANLSYTEDGNTVIFSGLQSWGRGDVTFNVTREEVRNGTQFYDGLRIGFEDISAGYRLNGIKVGDEDAPLQGGTELLLALGFYPSYEFDIDGQITLGAGGAEGEGLTINSDIQIRNGKAALIANPYDEGGGEVSQTGLWLTELSYDSHVRDMTIDVTDEGLAIVTGESWGIMDIGNVRIGDKDSGASFGRVVIQSYETGSSMTIVPGGSGTVCVGGSGGDESACAASGGLWEDRGEQGVTVRLKQVFAKALDDTRKNAVTWETNRDLDGSGNPINGTGTQLVLNDIYTSDGDDSGSNEFGIQTDIGVDVYQTRVLKKEDGPDSQGVSGSRGDEKIMDPGTAAGYRYVSNPSEAQQENRPLGFAVRAESRFKELSISNIDLVHPTGGAQTAIFGAKLQNVDIRANLTATPIQ